MIAVLPRFKRRKRGLLICYTAIASLLLVYTLSSGDPPGMTIFFCGVALLMAINLAIATYVITLIASLYPARLAARMEPVEALHGLGA